MLCKTLKIIKIIIVIIPIVILFWLVNKEFSFGGWMEASYNFKEKSPFISALRPKERVSEIKKDNLGNYYQAIIGDPVYFDLKTPQMFKKAIVEVVYQNNSQPVFQIGALSDKKTWQYSLKPLEQRMIDQSSWHKIREGEIILLQKEKKYESIGEFLNNLPLDKNIAVYNYHLNYDFKIPGYKPSGNYSEIEGPFEGKHQMYVYIKNEPLDFSFSVQNISRDEKASDAQLLVYSKDGEKAGGTQSSLAPDGGIIDLKLYLPNLKEGVYKIVFEAGQDILIKKIKTLQDKLVFANQLSLADSAKPTTVYSNGLRIVVQTPKAEGLQTLKIDNNDLDVEETYKQYIYSSKAGVKKIVVPKNHLLLQTAGLFSFSRESFFNPDIIKLSEDVDIKALGIDYIIASYLPPEEQDGWKRARQTFELGNLYKEEGDGYKFNFLFSAPGIAFGNKEIKIKEIKFILEREPIGWKNFMPKLKQYISRKVQNFKF